MKTQRLLLSLLLLCAPLWAGDIALPKAVHAGEDLALSGLPDGTLYVVGPRTAAKFKVSGGSVNLPGENFRAAGRYTLQLNEDAATFYIAPEAVSTIAFLARPSRVPASAAGAILGTAFVFDRFSNLVVEPQQVKFELSVEGAPTVSKTATSRDGAAWVKLNSGRKEGAAQFVASAGNASVRRVVQQVAAEPCNLRLKASQAQNGNILVETDPIRDCSGNAVPDGTIVTFASVDDKGRSTVDARIKRGTARAELPASPNTRLSVASGVVMGNEIAWGGR